MQLTYEERLARLKARVEKRRAKRILKRQMEQNKPPKRRAKRKPVVEPIPVKLLPPNYFSDAAVPFDKRRAAEMEAKGHEILKTLASKKIQRKSVFDDGFDLESEDRNVQRLLDETTEIF